ncbi:MAG: glycosyltransferase [Porphyromonadaceae bacterium]|nr:glycosyltransferase [Porphyromonadaceae bacterium]
MKIVYVLWSTAVMGGLETVTALKVNSLVDRGYDVSLITRRQKGAKPFADIDPRVEQVDIDVEWEYAYQCPNPIKRFFELKRLHRLYRTRILAQIRRMKPNIIVLTSFSEAEILKRSVNQIKKGAAPNAKIILESHSSKYFSLTEPHRPKGVLGTIGSLFDKIRKLSYEKLPSFYDQFVVLTHEDKDQWAAIKNIAVIPNPRRFETSDRSDYSAHKVITVGRYAKEKGHLDLIEIWSKVAHQYPDWTLEIVGDGYMRQTMQRRIEELGVGGSVMLHPATRDVVGRLKTASIFVLTSYSEGFPMVLAEAQALGLPIVSYACKCGPRDIVSDGVDGYLVSTGDIRGGGKLPLSINGRQTTKRINGQTSWYSIVAA